MSTPDPYGPASSDTSAESPFRNKWFIASAALLVAIVLLGVLVVITTSGDSTASDDGANDPAPAATTPAAPSSPPADGACPALADTPASVPSSPPSGVTWQLFRTMVLPSSTKAGPAVVDGDVARCYAHTPTGALLAATQISTRSTIAQDWKSVLEEQTYGDAKASVIEAREKAEAKSPAPSPEPGELGQIAGFRFVTYSADTAVVELVTRFSDPVSLLQASTATVQWRDGDWRYEVSSTHANPKVVSSLAGYAEWGGI